MGWKDLFFGKPPADRPDVAAESRRLQDSFRRVTAESPEQVAADQRDLEAGRLPGKAEERIRRTLSGELPWMSTLDIADLYLAEDIGIEPLVQVAGSCYFHAATDSSNRIYLDGNNDAVHLIDAYYEAKQTAMDRLLQEARLAGAHAVIDARHHFHRDKTVVEFSIIGTAVRIPGVDRPSRPLVSPLSGEEFYKLVATGYLPVGFALGYHWHCMPVGFRTRSIGQSFYNQEMGAVTQRFMQTREHAIARMRKDAKGHGRVHGIVAVQVTSNVEETEITYQRGYGGGSGVRVEGTWYPYDDQGQVEVPAYDTEFFATGASIMRVSMGRIRKGDLRAVLPAL